MAALAISPFNAASVLSARPFFIVILLLMIARPATAVRVLPPSAIPLTREIPVPEPSLIGHTPQAAIPDTSRPAATESDLLRAVRHPTFRVTTLLQAVGRIATDKDPVHTRNAFALDHVRLGLRTTLDSPLNAVFQFNFSKDPNLLDAYFTYRRGALLLKTGSFKPSQNLDLFVSPAQADFTGRGINSEYVIATRDIGVELMLGRGALQLHTGLFNGDRTSATPDNRYLWTGRLHVEPTMDPGARLMAGVFSQAGLSDQTKMGLQQVITTRGGRALIGADVRWETRRWILAGEVMEARIQTDPTRRSDIFTGGFLTAGVNTSSGGQWLARVQSFIQEGGPSPIEQRNLTLAWKRPLTDLWMIRVDGTFHVDDEGAFEEAGLAVNLQMVF